VRGERRRGRECCRWGALGEVAKQRKHGGHGQRLDSGQRMQSVGAAAHHGV
jgi:hypothetical protein